MPKVSEQHRLDRRDEIVDAALHCFRRKGFQSTSMAEIISESGLSAGAIYGYYASKSEIILAAATKIVGGRIVDLDHLGRLIPMPEPATMIRSLLDALLESLGSPGVLVQVWGEAATDPLLMQLCTQIFDRLRDAIVRYLERWQQSEHGLPEQDAHRLAVVQAPLFLSAVQGFAVQDTLFTNFDRESYLTASLAQLPR
jgi:AcrR family transcriptional regulator